MEILAFLANLGSLVGLAATLWAAWRAYRSKRYYLLVGRVPENIDALRTSASELAAANRNPSSERRERLIALKNMRVALESIARNIGRKHRGEFEELHRWIKKIEQNASLNPDELDDVWAEGEALASKAEEIVSDHKFARGS